MGDRLIVRNAAVTYTECGITHRVPPTDFAIREIRADACAAGTRLPPIRGGVVADSKEQAMEYVQVHGNRLLAALRENDSDSFTVLLNESADMPRIGSFVLGVHGRQLYNDAVLRRSWYEVSERYFAASLENALFDYRDSRIQVTNAVERVVGRDVIVMSEARPRGYNRPLPLQWRLLRSAYGWRVVDVSLVIYGNETWITQQIQRELIAELDRSDGNIPQLIDSVAVRTAELRNSILANTPTPRPN